MTISYYLNGTGPGYSGQGTKGLVGVVQDGSGQYRVGQSQMGTEQYTGKLQDMRLYAETLTNR